jgi:hypothetical protein
LKLKGATGSSHIYLIDYLSQHKSSVLGLTLDFGSIELGMGGMDKDDPFAVFLSPPPNETAEERILRERKEAEAQSESDRIDDEIKAEKAAVKKAQKGLVKVLLLGQSESGKSTTLKSSFTIICMMLFLPHIFPIRFPYEVRQ